MSDRWTFEIVQDGGVVASGDCPDRETALREAAHYVAMYGQDGLVKGYVSGPHKDPTHD